MRFVSKVLQRQEKKVREHPPHKTSWYESEGHDSLVMGDIEALELSPPPRPSDLLLHWNVTSEAGTDEPDIFICEEQQGVIAWRRIEQGFVHPLLRTHCLSISPGHTPGWITLTTRRSYNGPQMKRQRAKKGKSPVF